MKTNIILIIVLLQYAPVTYGSQIQKASANFFSYLDKADSIGTNISQNSTIFLQSDSSVDSLFISLINTNTQIYGLTRINSQGHIQNDINRDSTLHENKNVKNKNWFRNPLTNAEPYSGGIVNANSRLCFLKSYPIIDSVSKKANGVLAILIDVEVCLKIFSEQYDSPFTLVYNNSIVYQSDVELPLTRIGKPAYNKLELMYVDESKFTPINLTYSPAQVKSDTNPLKTIIPWFIAIISLTIGLLFRFSRPKITKEELISSEYEKLPEETQKLIHDRAVSQLYCEIKRQIEIHESDKIENEVRERLYKEIIQKTIRRSNMQIS